MYWLIQNYNKDKDFNNLLKVLNRLEISYSTCQLPPFAIECDFDDSEIKEPVFVYGSYSLARIAKLRGWISFVSDGLSQRNLLKGYGDLLLNSDMKITTIKDFKPRKGDQFFLRPEKDSKAINARIMTGLDFQEFKLGIMKLSKKRGLYATVTMDTEIVVCEPKPIELETRFFVVDGKIVTGSMYCFGNDIRTSNIVDQYIWDFAESTLDVYQPDKAYCLDIAISDNKPYVLETNCINSSGLYELNLQKFVMAIEDLGIKYYE